jgi:hypothetical protein
MRERENFLVRWSRRKRGPSDESEDALSVAQPGAPKTTAEANQAPKREKSVDAPTEPPFDPATLPSLESITAETDIRAFLARGVPGELTRAALRRVWAADPAIRDFVGLADYAWDFNSPGAMAGFGPLELTEDLRREIARLVTDAPREPPSENSVPESSGNLAQTPVALGSDRNASTCEIEASEQPDAKCDDAMDPKQRRHGGALPKT